MSNPSPSFSTQQERYQWEAWEALATHLRRSYYRPDLGALLISMSAVQSHFHSEQKHPVWVWLLGVPGSGKTEIGIETLCAFGPRVENGQFPLNKTGTNFHKVNDLSEKSLISGFQTQRGKNNKQFSLLHRLGKSAIILIPDFSLFLDKREEEQRTLISLMRRIWDGETGKDAGNSIIDQPWSGKLTLVGAAPPALEDRWTVSNSLGDRTLVCRWRGTHTWEEKTALAMACTEEGGGDRQAEIREKTLTLTKQFLTGTTKACMPGRETREMLAQIATLVTQTRRNVTRSFHGNGEIIGVGSQEEPTRIMIGIIQVARAHAELFGRKEPGPADIAAAQRLGVDTIPQTRRRLLDVMVSRLAIMDDGETTFNDFHRSTLLPISTLRYYLTEMAAVGMISLEKSEMQGEYCRFNKDFLEGMKMAGLIKRD